MKFEKERSPDGHLFNDCSILPFFKALRTTASASIYPLDDTRNQKIYSLWANHPTGSAGLSPGCFVGYNVRM